MKIGIVGGTGFVGNQLCQKCVENGHEVVIFSRYPDKVDTTSTVQVVQWPLGSSDVGKAEDIDCIVNLAGETINQRWTNKAKQRILHSRIQTTRQIVEEIKQGRLQPQVLINASAIGYYGHSADKTFDETSSAASDFLAQVCQKWEKEAEQVSRYGVRLVKIRLGVVLGKNDGVLPRITFPYKCWVGGKVGSGKQWLSWIHIDDLTALMLYAMENGQIHGVLNGTAPKPVQNEEFGKTIADILKRPHWMPVPAFALQILFGEMADLLLKGQYVLPEKAKAAGYTFQYPTIHKALQHLLGRE